MPERVAGCLVQGGTESDKAVWPLRSLIALWGVNQALDLYLPMFLKVHGPNIMLTNKLTILDQPTSSVVIRYCNRVAGTSFSLPPSWLSLFPSKLPI